MAILPPMMDRDARKQWTAESLFLCTISILPKTPHEWGVRFARRAMEG
jgi:hypothetical protein